MTRLMQVGVLVLLFPMLLQGQQKITVDDFLQLHYPREIAVSSDGEQIAYIVRSADTEESAWRSQLWLYQPSDGVDRQLTFGAAENGHPAWSPDGRWLTFLSDRETSPDSDNHDLGTTQIWALPLSGGEARRWTSSPTSIEDYQWSPDGRHIVYLADEGQPPQVRVREKRDQERKMDEVVKDSIRVNKVLYACDVTTRESREIAVLDPGVREFDISPDGNWIVYATNYTGEYNDAQQYDLWTLHVATGRTTQLTDYPGPETDPKFSPAGTRIAYIKQTTPHIEFAETDLAWCRFRPTRAAADTATLTGNYDRSVLSYVWLNRYELALQIADGTETPLVKLTRRRLFNDFTRLTPKTGNVSDLVLPAGKRDPVFYLWEDAEHLPEIAVHRRGRQILLTDNSHQLNKYRTGTTQIYRWESVDGAEIEGLLFLPPGFDDRRSYPMILTVHGGPYGRFRREFLQYYFPQQYTSDGYIVFAPNPRGSSGYSDAFGKAIWHEKDGHMGGIDYQDILAGVVALIRDGYVDSTRMGVTGGSYGGYMTNWIISQTNRFSAAVSMYGIFSLFTDWSNSWQPAWEKMYLGFYYWEKPISQDHPYVRYSPAFYVENIRTPTLIMHGTEDKYTNLSNSQEMYQALKTLGHEVKFVVYPREGHGLSDEPNHRRDVLRRAKRWFDKYVK